MSQSQNHHRIQTRLEETLNAASHFLGTALGITALTLLVVKSVHLQSITMIISSIIYALSLIIMFTASGIYHIVRYPRIKQKLKVLDHASIYILIAGSYTPFCLIAIPGVFGWILFGIIWSCAIAGVIFKLFFTHQFPKLSLALYLIMGWMAIIAIKPLLSTLSLHGFFWLLGGGLCYSFGVLFYVLDHRFHLAHFIWHLFVLAGSFLQFFAIYIYVIR